MLGGNQAEGPFDATRNRGQGGNLLLQIALLLLQQNGGLEVVIDKFREGGLAHQAGLEGQRRPEHEHFC